MLKKNLRINKSLFVEVLKRGMALSSAHILLRFIKTADSKSQFAFSTPKSAAKQAVKRNLLKRRGFSVIKKYIKSINPGHLCQFSFKKNSTKLSFIETEQEIIGLLKKAKILDF